jgi:hypothetical protein
MENFVYSRLGAFLESHMSSLTRTERGMKKLQELVQCLVEAVGVEHGEFGLDDDGALLAVADENCKHCQ